MLLSALRKIFASVMLCVVLHIVPAEASSGNTANQNTGNTHLIDSLKQKLASNPSDSIRIDLLYELTILVGRENRMNALAYVKEGISLCNKTNDTYKKVKFLEKLAQIYYHNSDYVKTNFYYFQAIRLLEQLKENTDIPDQYNKELSTCYNGIGLCFVMLKQYERAKYFFLKSLKYETPNYGRALSNLGTVAIDQGNIEEALLYHKQAFAQSNYTLGPACNNIGDDYIQLNQLDSAELYLKLALELNDKDIHSYCTSCISLGELYMKQNRLKEAGKYLFIAKEFAEKSAIKNLYPPLYENISLMYMKQQDYANAYKYKDKLYAFKMAEIDATVAKQVSEMQAKYESEKKDKEIQLLNQKQATVQAQARNQLMFRNFVIGAVVLVFIIGMVVFRNIVLKQRVKNKALNEEKVKLLHENISARYETLKSKVNPHFLFNSMSVLTSIVMHDQQSAVEYISRFSELYRMLLKTENKHQITLAEEMQVADHYLYLQKIGFEENLLLSKHVSDDMLQHLVPPFAVQMVLENAIKHNSITRLRKLHINIFTDGLYICITNNLQKKTDITVSTATGQNSIKGRYSLLTDKEPLFIETETEYIVRLPLLEPDVIMEETIGA